MRIGLTSILLALVLAPMALCAVAFGGEVIIVQPAPLVVQPVPQPQPVPPQVAAATDNAVLALRNAIGREELLPHLSVDEYLRRTGATDELLLSTLRHGELIGPPRWLDTQTCQVQLQISGGRIGRALLAIAATHPQTSPIPPDIMARIAADWERRIFAGLGSSTSSHAAELRPADTNVEWAGVGDDARQRAIATARGDAIERIIGSVRSLEMADHQLVGDAMLIPEVDKQMTDWLSSRPVTRVEFGHDMHVEMSLAATPEETFAQFRAIVTQLKPGLGLALPVSELEWSRFRKDWVARMALPVGQAVVTANTVRPATRTSLPAHAPDWVGRPLIVEGNAATQHNKLLAARAAETVARTQLLATVYALPLSPGATVGQAAQYNLRLRDALSRLAAEAPIRRIIYGNAARDTVVRIELDTHDLWDTITAN